SAAHAGFRSNRHLSPLENPGILRTVRATRHSAFAPVPGQVPHPPPRCEGSIGVVTFARFFGMHVLLLPPATALLIGVHIYLVRKHGVAPSPGDELLPKKKFYPEQVFKDTVAIFVTFAILFIM